MYFGYNTKNKNKSHSISYNTIWLLGQTGSATILGTQFRQLDGGVSISYNMSYKSLGLTKLATINSRIYWDWYKHQPQLPELCTQYCSQFNTCIELATIFIMQVLTYPVYFEIPFFNQIVLDCLCFCMIRILPVDMFVIWSLCLFLSH